VPNGLMMQQYQDVEGENRQAFYYGADSKPMPQALTTSLLGKRARNFDIIK
jgi:hypothetical protein